MRALILSILLLLIAACGPTVPPIGVIALTYPPANSTIYSDLLTVSGTLSDAPTQAIRVEVIDAAGEIRAHATAMITAGEWTLTLPLPAVSQPEAYQVEIVAGDAPFPQRSADTAIFASQTVVRAPLGERIDEPIMTIDLEAGTAIGGDTIPVNGRVSGWSAFTVELVDSSGVMRSSQAITLPNRLDEVAWSVALAPGSATGSALIRVMSDGAPILTVPIVLTSSAG
jgi:hypothetical protein